MVTDFTRNIIRGAAHKAVMDQIMEWETMQEFSSPREDDYDYAEFMLAMPHETMTDWIANSFIRLVGGNRALKDRSADMKERRKLIRKAISDELTALGR